MSAYAVKVEDHTRVLQRAWAVMIPPVVVPLFLLAVGAGWNTVFGSGFAMVAVGILWRGVRVTAPSQDPTLHMRVWAHPAWLRYTVVGWFGLCGLIALTLFAGMQHDLRQGFIGTVFWAAGTVALYWYATAHRQARRRRAQEPTTEAGKAAARVTDYMLMTAGLGVKSQASGMTLTPQIVKVGVAKDGNPCFVAQIIGGHQTVETWEKAAGRLASAWGVPRVTIRSPRTGVVFVKGVLKEFKRTEPVAWVPAVEDPAALPVAKYLSRLPLGEMGRSAEPWYVSLVDTSGIVIGGVPGSGKSSTLDGLLCHALRHPHVDLAFLDLKGQDRHTGKGQLVEAMKWLPRLSATADTQQSMAALLDWLSTQVQQRYGRMAARGVSNAWTEGFLGADEHVWVVVLDEAAEAFTGTNRESRALGEDLTERVRSLASRGRACGLVFVIATQAPSAETLPTPISKLMSFRVAHAVKTDHTAAAILGSDWYGATGDESPLTIVPPPSYAERGVAVVGDEAGGFMRVQAAYVDKALATQTAASTAAYRQLWPWAPDPLPGVAPTVETQPVAVPAPQPEKVYPPLPWEVQDAAPEPTEQQPTHEQLMALWEAHQAAQRTPVLPTQPGPRPPSEPAPAPSMVPAPPGPQEVTSQAVEPDPEDVEPGPSPPGPEPRRTVPRSDDVDGWDW